VPRNDGSLSHPELVSGSVGITCSRSVTVTANSFSTEGRKRREAVSRLEQTDCHVTDHRSRMACFLATLAL
jgi:hypothetical protein